MCVAIRSRNQRSCEITTAQPAKSSSASSSARSVSTSRSFVGSSSSSTLPPRAQQLREVDAVALAAREVADPLLLVGAPEVEPGDVLARVHLARRRARSCRGRREISFQTVFVGLEVGARLVDVGELRPCRRRAARRRPAAPRPTIMRKSVVLPAPFGPITPTMPPGGSENVRSSTSSRSPKPFATPSASTTTSPSRGPGGMWISTRSSLHVAAPRRAAARRRARRAFDFAWRARGDAAHPLELARERALARRLLLLLVREPRLLLLEPAGVVALVRDAAAAVELEDPAGDVVEEVAVVRDGDDGARVVGEEALEPGDRLGVEVVRRLVEQQQVGRRRAAAGRARRGGARRRRASSRRGRRRAAAARPSRGRASRRALQASCRSICSCTFACSASSASKSASGSANRGRDLVEAVEQVAQLRARRPRRCRARPWPGRARGSCASSPTVAPARELGACRSRSPRRRP